MEEAATSLGASSFTTFRRIVLPNLLPAILSGAALGFGRAIGEFGAVILISGNIPFETEVSSWYIFSQIESDRPGAAAAVSVVLLVLSLVVLVARRRDRALDAEARGVSRYVLRFSALGYLLFLLLIPVGMVFYRMFEDGLAAVWGELTSPAFIHALQVTLIIAAIVVPANTIFGILCALAIVRRGSGRGNWFLNSVIGLPLALSPVVVGLSLILVYGKSGWFGSWLTDHGIRIIFSLPGMVLATIFVSLPFVVREVVPVLREIGTDQEEAAWTLGASQNGDVLADHASGDPLGRCVRDRSDDGSRTRRVRSRRRGLRADRREDGDAHPSYRRALPARSTRPACTRPPSCSHSSPSSPSS